jgi:hypothetical protein
VGRKKMNGKRVLLAYFTVILWQSWYTGVAFSRDPGFSAVIPSVKNPPQIDGRLDDIAWKRSSGVNLAWTFKDEKVYERIQGQVLAVYDDAYLYIAFLNRVANNRRLDPDILAQDQDLISMDDRVEFVIDPGNAGKGAHFWVSVSAGHTVHYGWKASDALSARIRSKEILPELIPVALAYPVDREWKPQCLETAIRVERQSWSVEVKIAFEDLLQFSPPVGQTWKGNFMRVDIGPGSLPTAWTKTGGNLYNPEKFGALIFSE